MSKPTYEDMGDARIKNIALARQWQGKKIWYLTNNDIDHSGRGYYWPRYMFIEKVDGPYFHDITNGYSVRFRDIIKIIESKPECQKHKESEA